MFETEDLKIPGQLPVEVTITARDPNQRKTFVFTGLRGRVSMHTDYGPDREIGDSQTVWVTEFGQPVKFIMTVDQLVRGGDNHFLTLKVDDWPAVVKPEDDAVQEAWAEFLDDERPATNDAHDNQYEALACGWESAKKYFKGGN